MRFQAQINRLMRAANRHADPIAYLHATACERDAQGFDKLAHLYRLTAVYMVNRSLEVV